LDQYFIDATTPEIPKQRSVTGFIMGHWQPHLDVLSQLHPNGNTMNTLRAQEYRDVEMQGSALDTIMGDLKGTIRHTPTSFLCQFDTGEKRAFPKAKWQAWFCQSTGLPNPQIYSAYKLRTPCMCRAYQDPHGHHIQVCGIQQKGTWYEVHNDVQKVWGEVSRLAKISAIDNPARLPRPAATGSDQHADILFQHESHNLAGIVGDVTLTHPFQGSGKREAWGSYIKDRLTGVVARKNNTYRAWHAQQGYLFVALAATTYGRLCDDSIRLLFFFSHHAATNLFADRALPCSCNGTYTPEFLQTRARLMTRYTSRIVLAVCRASARRGLLRSNPGKIRGLRSVRTSDLDFGEDVPVWGIDRAARM
jgi:hypothetical protein